VAGGEVHGACKAASKPRGEKDIGKRKSDK